MKRLLSLLKRELVTGLLLIAPVAGTAYLVYWLVTFVDGFFPQAWRPTIRGVPLPGLGLAAVVVIALGVGFAAHNFVGRRLVDVLDDLVHRIPLFGSTYGLIKQVLEAVFSSGAGGSFKRAVLVEYPLRGTWTLGFVTQSKANEKLEAALETDVVAVFVPTTPNPTSGLLLFVPADRVRPVDLPVEQAFKMILTMGIADATPETLATTGKWQRNLIK